MYYKIIENKHIIDVVKNLRYFKYVPHNGRYLISDASGGDCIRSDNGYMYGLLAHNLHPSFKNKRISFKEITKDEYDKLKIQLRASTLPEVDEIEKFKLTKIQELKDECDRIINEGISIRLSDNKIYHFELSTEDQLNLKTIENNMWKMGSNILYHQRGHRVQLFSKEDMKVIIREANRHVYYNTTYFNLLKYCILDMETYDQINNIRYGVELPNEEHRILLNYVDRGL